jgi:hypothetical protein
MSHLMLFLQIAEVLPRGPREVQTARSFSGLSTPVSRRSHVDIRLKNRPAFSRQSSSFAYSTLRRIRVFGLCHLNSENP